MKPPLLATIQTELSKVQSGDWFLPMTIKEIDQHAFIQQALAQGAAGFTYERGQEAVVQSQLASNHLVVPNLREHLFSLAREKRALLHHTEITVVAGSAGKTSVKELVGSILKAWHPENYFLSPDNQNTKIALATQILRLPESCQYAAFEMGARRLYDFLVPLSYLQPSVVALLNIGTAHVGEFGSLENLSKEKLSCLNSQEAHTLVIPSGNSKIFEYARSTGKNIISFGFSDNSTVQILKEESKQLTLHLDGQDLIFDCPFQSSAKSLNVAAAVAIARALKAPLAAIHQGLSEFRGVPRRFQIFKWGGTTAIDDAFNASPESLKEGLEQLQRISEGQKVLLVLGSMLELGDATESEHRKAAHLVHDLFGSCTVVTIGDEAKVIHQELHHLGVAGQQLHHFSSSSEALPLLDWRNDFDLIYFKGSKSMHLEKIFGVS